MAIPNASQLIMRLKGPAVGCVGCCAGLALLTWFAYDIEPFARLDAASLSWVAEGKRSFLANSASFFAHLMDPLRVLAMLSLICLLALVLGRLWSLLAAIVLVAGANATTLELKIMLAHSRYQPDLGYHQIVATAFPSGHSTAAMSLALALVFVSPRSWRPAAAPLAALLVCVPSLSLLILRTHFVSDIIGGWLVAGAWCFALIVGMRIAKHQQMRQAASQAVRSQNRKFAPPFTR